MTPSTKHGRSRIVSEHPDPAHFTSPVSTFADAAADAGLSGDDARPDAEPLGDGVPKLLKFAFNLDLSGAIQIQRFLDPLNFPGQGSIGPTAGLPIAYLPPGPLLTPPTIIRQFLRRKDGRLRYSPQKSTTLGSFAPLEGNEIITEIDETLEHVTVKEPIDLTTTPRLFSVVEIMQE